jgi:hypothetical protein
MSVEDGPSIGEFLVLSLIFSEVVVVAGSRTHDSLIGKVVGLTMLGNGICAVRAAIYHRVITNNELADHRDHRDYIKSQNYPQVKLRDCSADASNTC